MIEPIIGPANAACKALGIDNPRLLGQKFTRSINPWPAQFRIKDNSIWMYDIQAIKNWMFSNNNKVNSEYCGYK